MGLPTAPQKAGECSLLARLAELEENNRYLTNEVTKLQEAKEE